MSQSNDPTPGRICYKVWLEIEQYNEETGRSEDIDAPGAALAVFATYDDAYAFAASVTHAHGRPANAARSHSSFAQSEEERLLRARQDSDWDRPYPITSICKNDVLLRFSREQVDRLDFMDLQKLARRMEDSYVQSCFWDDLDSFVQELLEEKTAKCPQEEDR